MKRFLATILAVIYFTASTGATVNIHYCMGKLQSMDLWSRKDKKKACDNCGMTNKKGCCEDKHQVIKIEKKYNAPVTTLQFSKTVSVASHYFGDPDVVITADKGLQSTSSNSPPGVPDIPLFIRNCVFLI